MKKSLLCAVLAALMVPYLALAWEGQVTKVTDGDTLDVRRPASGETKTVRLYGIDTPESDQPHGKEATSALEELVAGERIKIEKVENGPYGRTIAIVRQDGECINELLVQRGHAWVYDQYCERFVCYGWKGLELKARALGDGLWEAENPVPPWEWRH
jgi:endonuclease YncB( thermonuclease family)